MAIENARIEELLKLVDGADTVIIGTGPNLMRAGRSDYSAPTGTYQNFFGAFEDRMHLGSVAAGVSMRQWPNPGVEWAFWALYEDFLSKAHVPQAFQDLKALVEGKKWHVITATEDGLARRAFGDEHVTLLQGDHAWLQCEKRCEDELYGTLETMEPKMREIRDCAFPSSALPKCPHCGADLIFWTYGYHFLEGAKKQEQFQRWNDFLQQNMNSKILFVTAGVGLSDKHIKMPFWQMVQQHPSARFVAIEAEQATPPEEIAEKCLVFEEDIAGVLRRAVELRG